MKQSAKYVPLQSHGIKCETEVWQAPDLGPFMSADESDEWWMRPLCMNGDRGQWGKLTQGVGIAPLYDVYDEELELIGYCALNPVTHFYRSYFIYVDTSDKFPIFKADRPDPKLRPFDNIVKIEIIRYGSGGYGSRMLWKCHLSDASRLIDCGFLSMPKITRLQLHSRIAQKHNCRRVSFYGRHPSE